MTPSDPAPVIREIFGLMYLLRKPDGAPPRGYEVHAFEEPRVWRWRGGYSALGRSREEAEMMLRDAYAPELA